MYSNRQYDNIVSIILNGSLNLQKLHITSGTGLQQKAIYSWLVVLFHGLVYIEKVYCDIFLETAIFVSCYHAH